MTTTDSTPADHGADAWRVPPDGLSASAADLWDGVVNDWDVDGLEPEPAERALLTEAARVLTAVDEMSSTITEEGRTVPGPGGRPVAHPLLGPVDTSRRTLALLLKQIGQVDRQTSSAANGLRKHGRS